MVNNPLPIGKKSRLRPILWLVALLVLAGGGYAYWQYRQKNQPPPVVFQSVALERRSIIGKVTATGTLQARVTVQVGSQVSGRIQKLFADYNSTVKKGDVIAKIDPTLFDAAVAKEQANYLAAKANLAKAKAQTELAERQFTRLKALGNDQLATQSDIDSAETNVAVNQSQIGAAEAALAQAVASLQSAKTNRSFTTIISPIDGTVISRSVDVGQTVAASLQAPTIFTIAEDLKKMQVSTNISESDVGRLAPGMKASFTVDAFPGQRFYGSIGQVRNAAQTVQNVVTYNAIIEFDNPEFKLRPGMTASVSIVYAERNDVLVIPNAALRFVPPPEANLKTPERTARARPDTSAAPGAARAARSPSTEGGMDVSRKTVWVPKGVSAESLPIKVGLSDGSYTELLDDKLKEGDKVVTEAIVNGQAASAKTTTQSPAGGGMRRMF
ncbi:MAG TPA: efflux RND transporter periplasmic adaptor subunit [Polyangiaceae bacterium]|nr:efflux RND transporter periplasmic adaptor subunit [Polyangiaceae bacterium]